MEAKFRILEEWKIDNGYYKCPNCNLSFSKNGLTSHYFRKHDERGISFIEKRKLSKVVKRLLTKEEKSKILSDSKKKSFLEGRSKGWSHINEDKNRRSYPEKFFLKVFENDLFFKNFKILEKISYGKYVIDFLFVDFKLVVEIDGDQHYRNKESILHDEIRDKFFINDGFKVYRIKWKDVINNSKKEINQLISFIENIDFNEYRSYTIDNFEKKKCECGNIIKVSKSKWCRDCYNKSIRKVDRPSLDQLMIDVEMSGFRSTGRKYGVSDNTIRKWIGIVGKD
jgi:very-short-patch-repair endonuclease